MPIILFAAMLWLWSSSVRGQGLESESEWAAPASQARQRNPIPADDRSISAGQKVYLKRCAACHGKTGNGNGPDAVDLGLDPAKFSDRTLREQSDGALFWKITIGKKPMPGYGSRLSPTDRWNVINFLRTLSRK